MSDKQKSWLFEDVPVYKVGEGKKARWFAEVGGQEVEVRPVNAYTLWVIWRTYSAQIPEVPVLEMELEGVAASQRSRNPQDAEYLRKTAEVMTQLDEQLTAELMKGIVVPPDAEWAGEWIAAERPLPTNDPMLRTDIYLAVRGLSFQDRVMLIRVVQAITEETPSAIQRAQEFFRLYMGGPEAEVREDGGRLGAADDAEGRGDGGDAVVEQDAGDVVQVAAGGPGADGGVPAQPKPKRVSKRAR